MIGPVYQGPIATSTASFCSVIWGRGSDNVYFPIHNLNLTPGSGDRGLVPWVEDDPLSDFRGVLTFAYDWSERLYVADYAAGSSVSNLYVIEER